jgi:Fuc2NAc and GlcNAc transferase
MKYWYFFPIVVLLSLVLTAVLRQYALHRSIIDIPNARSSHSIPTPRGGGVAIVVTFLISLVLLGCLQLQPFAWLTGLVGAGSLVAVIGFMDDHGHIAARWRLLLHFVAALWALFWFNGLPVLSILGFSIDLGWIGHALAAFYLVWMLNLYNFMDGIDGLASVEAISVCLGMCAIYFFFGFENLIWTPATLAMAVTGFLFWNFPPAKIFMGDAGSGFLGITLGILSLQAVWAEPGFLWAWLIMLGVFICDATFTLLRRLLRGDRVYEAHRSHGYQFASRKFAKHLPVTAAVLCINIFWLLPIAFLVMKFQLVGFLGLVFAYIPLIFLAVKFNSGAVEHSNLR